MKRNMELLKTAKQMSELSARLHEDATDITKNVELMEILGQIEASIRSKDGDVWQISLDEYRFRNPLTHGHLQQLGYKVTIRPEDYVMGDNGGVCISWPKPS